MIPRKFLVLSALISAGGGLLACRNSQDPVIARLAGTSITKSEAEFRMQATPAEYQQYLVSAEGRRQFIQLLIREKVLVAEARRAGLAKNSAYRDALRRFDRFLKLRRKEYEEDLLASSYSRQLRSGDLAVTDAETRRYYEDRKNDYDKPEEIRVSHILVSSEPETLEVLARLRANEPFEKVAREMSKDPATASRGGKLSPLRHGALMPEFEDVAFRLKVGEVSGAVKTPFGFHIIKKLGQAQLPPQSYESVKEGIRARLEREKFDQWVTKKKEALGVTIDEKALASLEPLSASAAPQEPPQP
ncbi:MAG: peptidylprolyl isomerase [Elusimicrobiota bacterium]